MQTELPVLPQGGISLYQQVRLALEELIKSGGLKPGDRLPTENELRSHYELSSTTVRRALLELEKDGLIYRHPGLGTFVARREKSTKLLLLAAGYNTTTWRNNGDAIFGQLIGGITHVAWEHYAIASMMYAPPHVPLRAVLTPVIDRKMFDGVILRTAGDVEEADLDFLESRRYPHVFIRRSVPGREMSCVTSDDEEAAYQATNHLIQLGHKRIGLVLGPRSANWFMNRERGYRRALDSAGLPFDPDLIRLALDYTEREGQAEAQALFAAVSPPSAIFAATKLLSVGVLIGLKEMGLRIPDDVALVGCDDGTLGRDLSPPLTAATVSVHDLGIEAARMLIEIIEHGTMLRKTIVLKESLIIRESCGASRSRNNLECHR